MITSSKYYKYLIIVLLILLAGTIFWLKMKPKHHTDIIIAPPSIQPVTNKVDKKGNSYSQITEKVYAQKEVDELADSLKRVYKLKKVTEVVKIVNKVDTVYTEVPVQIDSISGEIHAREISQYSDISFDAQKGGKFGRFTLHLTPDTISILKSKFHPLFGPNEQILTIVHSDQLVKTIGAESFTTYIPRSVLDFDIFIGYDPFLKKLVIAPGIGMHIFSIKSRK